MVLSRSPTLSLLFLLWTLFAGPLAAQETTAQAAAARQVVGAPAAEVILEFPLGIALGPDGVVFVSERQSHRVRKLDPASGRVTVFAGTGERGFSGDGGLAAKAQLGCPDSIDADQEGNLFIADRCNHRIRRVDARTGIITTVAGNGERGASADGPALERSLMGPFFVRAESARRILFTDTDSHRIRQVDLTTGLVTTLAGSGERGHEGDGGPALQASFARPHVALYARDGDLIIGDSFNQRIRRVDHETQVVRTIAGSMELGAAADGSPALDAPFGYFGGIEELKNGDLLVTEWVNGRLLRLEKASGLLRVLAGTTDEAASPADGQPLRSTSLGRLADFALDNQGRVVVACAADGIVRRIDLKRGTVETLIGPPPTKKE